MTRGKRRILAEKAWESAQSVFVKVGQSAGCPAGSCWAMAIVAVGMDAAMGMGMDGEMGAGVDATIDTRKSTNPLAPHKGAN